MPRSASIAVGLTVLAAWHAPAWGRFPAAQVPAIEITSPHGRIATTGALRIVAQLRTENPATAAVVAVRFFVDDALIGEDAEGPVYAAEWMDKNPFLPATIRAEAIGDNGVIGTDTVMLPAIEITDESRVASVLLDVSVLDEEGQYVRGLTRDRFGVFEDGTPQAIDLMNAALVPTTHTLLVDTSQSMSYRFEFVRRAARRLGSTMKAGDQMIVLPFSRALGAMTGPTTDLEAIASAVDTLQAGGGTAIADAVLAASERLGPVEGRQIIVLLTDGYDEHSESRFDQARDAVRRLHGTLYTVGIGGAAGISIRGRDSLKTLALGTGGQAFFPFRDEEIPSIHDRVAADVASRYLLTYTPANQSRDGLWRSVEVKTDDPTHKILTREGYYAAAPIPIRPTLEFTARDLNRRPISITASDLIVYEDGVEQTVTSFQEAVSPVSMLMALDKSGSMRRDEEAVRAAAGAFIDSLRPEDALGVVGFADDAEMLADVAPYRTWSRHAVNQYRTGGGTALYDAIGLSLERLATVKGRRAIVLMTDGRDEDNPGTGPGSTLTLADILERLAQTDVAVFAIGLGPRVDRATLEKLAEVSNGEAYFPMDVTLLADEYRRVTEDLRRRYLVGYTSTNPRSDGQWRTVEMHSRTDGIVFTSRGGYQAPEK
ncbi:MAG: VWA domain-containing protein [Acidobacteriota bacterium]